MKIFRTLMFILTIIGIVSMAYPTVANFIADYTSTQVIIDYEKKIAQMEKMEIERQKEEARKYNKNLTKIDYSELLSTDWSDTEQNTATTEKTAYREKQKLRDTKKVYKKGELLGYIEIEKINVQLPVYEGTHDSVLQKGIGHLTGSSLPVGGKTTHSIFTGHSGLAKATLFSRLNELKINDVFIIHFLDEILAYEVDNIEIVEPNNADKYLSIEKDKDYVTLITCTPITVNTHRLLVRGRRIPYTKKIDSQSTVEKIKQQQNDMKYIIAVVLIVLLILLVIITQIHRKKSKRANNSFYR